MIHFSEFANAEIERIKMWQAHWLSQHCADANGWPLYMNYADWMDQLEHFEQNEGDVK